MPAKPPTKSKRFVSALVLDNDTLCELVHRPIEATTAFVVGGDDEAIFHDRLRLPSGETVFPIPATNNLLVHQAILLPEALEPFGSVEALVADIEAYINRYVDISPGFMGIAVHYVLLTWVYDAFQELPYLRFRGEPGSGKTRALIVIGSLCYQAFFASGASTVSPIFHTLDTFRGTLILDEADFRFSDAKAELVKIFNNGNVRGFPVFRAVQTPGRTFDPQAFHVFGPKIVAMREGFQDRALESRFITEEMGLHAHRSDIPINLPPEQAIEAQQLRNKLLSYRFHRRFTARVDATFVNASLSSRLNQILVPLLSIIPDPAVRDDALVAALHVDQTLRSERQASPEVHLLEVLAEVLSEGSAPSVPLSEVTERFRACFEAEYERAITPRFLGSLLRNRLHLTSYKSHGRFVIPRSELAKVQALCARFGIAS